MNAIAHSIVLIGFMGTGKSEIGVLLAKILDWPLFDTDAMIEDAFGRSIAEIFAKIGEERFRTEEATVLHKISGARPSVIVTGGGTVLLAENVARMRQLGTVVRLTASAGALKRRLADGKARPLLPAKNRGTVIRSLLEKREPYYQQAADLTFDTSPFSPGEVSCRILKSLALSY